MFNCRVLVVSLVLMEYLESGDQKENEEHLVMMDILERM